MNWMKLSVAGIIFCLYSCNQNPAKSIYKLTNTSSSIQAISITATNIDSPTITITQKPSHTLIPTLPYQEAINQLITKLHNNGDCVLPCLFNIIPNHSTVIDAMNLLMPYKSISSSFDNTFGSGSLIIPIVTNDITIEIAIMFGGDNGIINLLTFGSVTYDSNGALIFNYDYTKYIMEYYLLPNMLSTYGIPESIYIATISNKYIDYIGPFDLLLLYPSKGFAIIYNIPMKNVNGTISACPANSQIKLQLFGTEQSKTFDEMIPYSIWGIDMPFKKIEDVTSLNIEIFYEMYKSPTNYCITTLSSNWPLFEI